MQKSAKFQDGDISALYTVGLDILSDLWQKAKDKLNVLKIIYHYKTRATFHWQHKAEKDMNRK